MRRLLVVEDDARIREELCLLLGRNGYEAEGADGTGDVVTQVLAPPVPDLVLLDLNLPGLDGTYVCREIRRRSDVPVIAVTSRDSDLDELLTLSLGADDFVPKPYNDQILLARIASVLKRSYGDAQAAELSHGPVTLDAGRCRVTGPAGTAELTKNELRILSLLMRSAGTVVSRQRLQEELWSSDEFVDDNTLSVNVSHLRRTLEGVGAPGYVVTRRGLGYLVE